MKNPFSDEIYHKRLHPRNPDIRGDYFRDQTAIIHATPFRRLKHKTQVFFAPQNDHICTRIEHVLHVSTIATTICKGLGLDVELAQAIALGHDLGHAPFGHSGEKALDRLSRNLGGFIHEIHSLRVVDRITRDGKGLNLTYAVRDGIVSHCGEQFQQVITPAKKLKDLENLKTRQSSPLSYEGCAVRAADIIAYLGRDIEDAITAGLISSKDIPADIKKTLGTTNGEIIESLVEDLVDTSINTDSIVFSDSKFKLICELRDFNYSRIYNHSSLVESDSRIAGMIEALWYHLESGFNHNGLETAAYKKSRYKVEREFGLYIKKRLEMYEKEPRPEKAIVDFVAGMSDLYALESAREVMFPKQVS